MQYAVLMAKLGHNIALGFLAVFVMSAVANSLENRGLKNLSWLFGIGFGLAGIIGMLSPVEIAPGVIMDGRVVMIAMGGVFGGAPGAVISAVMVIVFRMILGGPGVITGIGVAVTGGVMGYLYRRICKGNVFRINFWGFFALGIALLLAIQPWVFALPEAIRQAFLPEYIAPMIVFFPASTLALGLLVSHEFRRRQSEKELRNAREELESRVAERTGELEHMNAKLEKEIKQRGEIENALLASEEYYRKLVERIPDILFCYDRDGRHLYASLNVKQYTGLDAEEFIGKTHREIGYPEDLSRLRQEAIRKVFDTGLPQEEEFEIFMPHMGRKVFLNWRLFPETGPGDVVQSVLGVSVDVTRRRQAEEALRKSEEAYRELVEQSQSIILRLDPQGNVTFLNEFGREFFGFSADEILGRPIFGTLIPETDSTGCDMSPLISRLLSNPGEIKYNENENVRKNGERVWVYWANSPVYDADGELSEVRCIGTDATDRKKTQEALRRLRRALEQSPLSVIITNAKGDIEYVNPFFSTITGYGEEEVMGKNPCILKSGVHPQEFYEEMWESISAGRNWRGEICNRKKNGELYWESSSISPVRSRSGEITHYIAVKEDITERKRTEALREDVDRIIAHDLKAPVNGFINLPELILMDDNLTDDQRELLEVIRGTGERMLDMINLSGDMFKMETGVYKPRKKPVNLVPLLKTILAEGPGESAVSVAVDGKAPDAETSFVVLGDVPMYRSLLTNLVKNALEAAEPGGEVGVEMAREDGMGVVRISNTGVVPRAIRKNFFEKYITLGKERGTGLGTYSARLITQSNGGTIDMRTDDEGNSTTITVRLPLMKEE